MVQDPKDAMPLGFPNRSQRFYVHVENKRCVEPAWASSYTGCHLWYNKKAIMAEGFVSLLGLIWLFKFLYLKELQKEGVRVIFICYQPPSWLHSWGWARSSMEAGVWNSIVEFHWGLPHVYRDPKHLSHLTCFFRHIRMYLCRKWGSWHSNSAHIECRLSRQQCNQIPPTLPSAVGLFKNCFIIDITIGIFRSILIKFYTLCV